MRKTRIIVVAAAVLFITAGCAAFRSMGGQQNENKNVVVTDDGKGGCNIAAIGDIRVSRGNSAVLNWSLPAAGNYEFDPQIGIKFVQKQGDPIPAGEFVQQNASATTWIVLDNGQTPGKFGYEVHVKGKAPSTATCMLDPYVVNE